MGCLGGEIRKHEGLKEVCDSSWESGLCAAKATVWAQKMLSNVQSTRTPEQGLSLLSCWAVDGCSFAICANAVLWGCVTVQNCQRKLSLHLRKLFTDGVLLTEELFWEYRTPQNIYEGWWRYLFIYHLMDILSSLFCCSLVSQNICSNHVKLVNW